jgi:hypothetical protein
MRSKPSLLFFLILLFLSTHSYAQNWSGILSTARAVNWANAGVAGGVPSGSWTQCGSTIAAYGTSGSPASASTINNAIASCAANHYVLLGAGTFYLNSMVDFADHSNVALRGAGANQTFLIFAAQVNSSYDCYGQNAVICVEGGFSSVDSPNETATWSAGYSAGTTSITLSSVTGLTAGQSMIVLDQCDDGFGGTACTTGSATDTGNIFVCAIEGTCTIEGTGGGGRTNRAQEQYVLVTGISGTGPYTVNISPGLYMPNWRSSQSPGAWWSTAANQLNYSGVENLSTDSSATTCTQNTGSCGITIANCYACWVTGTRTIFTSRDHIWLLYATHTTVANNYMYGTLFDNTESYGVESFFGSDNLIVNNISDYVSEPYIATGADAGDVWAYNFSTDNNYNSNGGWLDVGDRLHAGGTGMDLWEGSITQGFQAENIHGTHNFSTAFRNYYAGNQTSCFGIACQQPTEPIQLYCNSRYFSIIGNVLGTSGYHNNYAAIAPSGIDGATSIYVIGWSDNTGTTNSSYCVEDTLTPASVMRWGNYDSVTGAVRWCGNSSDTGWSSTCGSTSEVPSNFNDTAGSPSPYVNSVPSYGDTGAGQSPMPASFYYDSQPSFWATTYGTPPWPANGPDVTGGNIQNVGGHANNNPAALVWINSPVDPHYQVSYTIASASWSSGTETLNFSSGTWSTASTCSPVTPPICIPGGEIRISGASPSGLNGSYQVTASTTNSVSFALAANPGTFSSGTMLYPNVRLFTATAYGASSAAPVPPTGLTAVVQ